MSKNIEEIAKTYKFYKLKFIYGTKFMASSLSNLVNNVTEIIHKIENKYGHDNKKICNVWN